MAKPPRGKVPRAFSFLPLENPFQKGAPGEVSRWCGRGTAGALPHGEVRRAAGRAHGSLSTPCSGIQVKQESVQDQGRGAWKIPSVCSGLVSPPGVFSVYLFFSGEHGGPRLSQRSSRIGTGQILPRAGQTGPLFAPCSKKPPAVLPGPQPLEKLGPGHPSPCRKSHFSRTSHPWEPGFTT